MKYQVVLSLLWGIILTAFVALSTALSGAPTIKLVDAKNAATIECTKNGDTWVITNPAQASAYLTRVAKNAFEYNLTDIHDVEVEFDSLYNIGALTGIGSKNGSNVPIGVQFERTANPHRSPAGLVTMGAAETHTCSGAPCECCRFQKEKGKINGCFCYSGGRCIVGEGDRCNHTVTTTQ
jgi:hypothetical protein